MTILGDYSDMGYIRNLDPCLQSLSLPSSSDPEYFSQDRLDLFADDFKLASSSTTVETIQPAPLTNMSSPAPSFSSPSSSSSPATSPIDSTFESDSEKSRGRRPGHVDTHDHTTHAKRHQTKLACNWCRKLSKKCDAQRPCGRCIQFNRCSECVNAPPRRPRVKGILRGTYKTRDLPIKDHQMINRREDNIAKQGKQENETSMTSDDLLKRQITSEEIVSQQILKQPWMFYDENLRDGFVPFSGPIEDLFTCTETPGVDEQLFPPSSSDDSFSAQISPLFKVSSTMAHPISATDYGEFDFVPCQCDTTKLFPNLVDLIDVVKGDEISSYLSFDDICRWTDSGILT